MGIKLVDGGLFTTVQDRGRVGYQRFGMSVAGAMDLFALRTANLLVGNDAFEAALECTFKGPVLTFDESEIIAITGADMQPTLNGKAISQWKSVRVKKGDTLALSAVKSGLRTYIAFSKGLDVPLIMGSRSTFLRGKLGGHKGRKLAKGDQIGFQRQELSTSSGSFIKKEDVPLYKRKERIRVVLGPQADYFQEASIDTFLQTTYRITGEADRMGYRLEGEKILHKESADIISDGIVFGSIQVPGHGMPIIMMADRATTGGYTKIATVLSVDLPKLAQMAPGSEIHFEKISVEEAQACYREEELRLQEIEEKLKDNRFDFDKTRQMQIKVNGFSFEVTVDEVHN